MKPIEMLEILLTDIKNWMINPDDETQAFVMYQDLDTEETDVYIITVQKGRVELAK